MLYVNYLDWILLMHNWWFQVIISAAIYLKLKVSTSIDDNQEKNASQIAHHISNKSGRSRTNQCLQQLLTSNADVRDLIFMKPLNVKLLFECLNHPKAKNSKDIILTNSSVDVNITLTWDFNSEFDSGDCSNITVVKKWLYIRFYRWRI